MTLRFQYIKKCLTYLRAVEPIHNSIIGLLQRKKKNKLDYCAIYTYKENSDTKIQYQSIYYT